MDLRLFMDVSIKDILVRCKSLEEGIPAGKPVALGAFW